MKKVTYRAKGICLGNLWGGGRGWYPTETYYSDSIDHLMSQLWDGVDKGTIDSGMGFESIIGAVVTVITITEVEVDGLWYSRDDYDVATVGKLELEDVEQAEEILYNS